MIYAIMDSVNMQEKRATLQNRQIPGPTKKLPRGAKGEPRLQEFKKIESSDCLKQNTNKLNNKFSLRVNPDIQNNVQSKSNIKRQFLRTPIVSITKYFNKPHKNNNSEDKLKIQTVLVIITSTTEVTQINPFLVSIYTVNHPTMFISTKISTNIKHSQRNLVQLEFLKRSYSDPPNQQELEND